MGYMRTITDLNLDLRVNKKEAMKIDIKIDDAIKANKEVDEESKKLASIIDILNGAFEILEIDIVNLQLYIKGDYIHGMERDMRFINDDIFDH